MKNCLNCKRFPICNDQKRSFNYFCNKHTVEPIYSLNDESPILLPLGENGGESKQVILTRNDFDTELHLVETLNELLDPNTRVPHDLKIDDRDIKEFPNFYKFCFAKDGLNQRPFARQLIMMAALFGEICPRCSDTSFSEVTKVPVDYPADKMDLKVTFLEFGICPKCKVSKSELLHGNEINLYGELVACIGQRSGKCVINQTLMTTSKGMFKIGDLCKDLPQGFTKVDGWGAANRRGRLKKISHFYVEKPLKNTLELTLSDGTFLGCTTLHPIFTNHGFKKSSDLEVGNNVVMYINQNVWAKEYPSLKPYHRRATKKLKNTRYPENKDAYFGVINPLIARTIGYIIAEGYSKTVVNCDMSLLEDVSNGLKFLFNEEPRWLKRRNKKEHHEQAWNVSFKGVHNSLLMDEILDGGLEYKSAQREIPSIILQSPKDIVCEFLKALFEGDGSPYGNCIEYATNSRELSHQLKAVLANLGIASKIKSRGTWAKNGSENQVSKVGYRLLIEGLFMLKRFREHVGFISPRKVATLNKIIGEQESRILNMPFFYDKYPDEYKPELFELEATVANNLRRFRNESNTNSLGINTVFKGIKGFGGKSPFHRLRSNNVCITRNRILAFTQTLKPFHCYLDAETIIQLDKWEKRASNYDMYLVEVEDIRENPNEIITYDISVPDGHEFVGNGIVNHNTTSLNMGIPYLVHKYLKLQRPTEAMGLVRNTLLVGTIVALTYEQATKTVWIPVQQTIAARDDGSWFAQYNELLEHYAFKYSDPDLYKIKDTFIHYKHRSMFIAPSGPNKRTLRGSTRFLCLVGNTQVLTNAGWIPINKNRLVGHTALTGNERGLITYQQHSGHKDVYKLTLSNGMWVIGTADHKFPCRDRDNKLAELPLSELEGCQLAIHAKPVENEGSVILPYPPRILGDKKLKLPRVLDTNLVTVLAYLDKYSLYYADTITLAIPASSANRFILAWKQCFTVPLITTAGSTYAIKINHQGLTGWLKSIGVGLYEKHVPWCILRESSEIQRQYVSFFEDVYDKKLAYHGAGKLHTQQLQFILLSLGIYTVVRNQNLVPEEATIENGLIWLPVSEIEYYGISDVYDITVEDTHLFTANGIVTHNCVCDELGWFPFDDASDEKERMSANEVYGALDRSLKTVRSAASRLIREGYNNFPMAYAFNISSPSSIMDKIMSLVQTYNGSPDVLTVHLPTWEFNPTLTKEDFRKEYRENPQRAERDYGANPPLNESPFVEDMDNVYKMCHPKGRNRVDIQYKRHTTSSGKVSKYGVFSRITPPANLYPAVMAIDAGQTNNSFVITVGHRVGEKAVVDVIVEMIPYKNQDSLNFSRIAEHLMYPLIEKFNIKFVVADRWQSIKLLSDVEENFGIETATYSLKYADMVLVRDYITDENPLVTIPKCEIPYNDIVAHVAKNPDNYPKCFKDMPVAHLLFQISTVVDTGRFVLKGPRLTDDIFRSFFLALKFLLDDEFVEDYLTDGVQTRQGSESAIGYAAGLSSGGGQSFVAGLGIVLSRG